MKTPNVEDVKASPRWPAYSTTFSRLMSELGSWSEEQCKEHLESLLRNQGFRHWFPHDNPSKEAAPLLLPEDLRESLAGLPWVRVRQRIEAAIDLTGDQHNPNPDNDPGYDWEAARQRVAKAVKEFRMGSDFAP